MMFTWVNKQTIRSDDGTIVEFRGIYRAEYRAGQKIVTIPLELIKPDGISLVARIGPSSFDRWNSGEEITASERTRMFDLLRGVFAFQGIGMVVEPI